MSGIPERLWRVVKGHWLLMRERAQNALGGDDPVTGETLADRLNAARARLEARGELDRDDLLAVEAKIEETRAMADAYAELGRHLEEFRLPVAPTPGRPAVPAAGRSSEVRDPLAICYDLLGVRPGVDLAELDRAYHARLAEIGTPAPTATAAERSMAENQRRALTAAYERLRDVLNPVETRFEKLEF